MQLKRFPFKLLINSIFATSLSAQVSFRSSVDGLLSVRFTELTEFSVASAGTTDEVLIIIENAYSTAQQPLSNSVNSSVLPFLEIDELDVASWELEIGAGTAAPGTLNEIDSRDLILRFALNGEAVISTDQTMAFGLGSLLSTIPFPAPDNLSASTHVLFKGRASTFASENLVVPSTLLPLNLDPALAWLEKPKNNGLTLMTLSGAAGDRELEYSDDLVDWQQTGLFVPPDQTIMMPISTNGELERFYRLSTPNSELLLSEEALSVSGQTIEEISTEESDSLVYLFRTDHTGEQYSSSGNLNWHFTWSEVSGPGMATVSLTFPDGYLLSLNLQKPLQPLADSDYLGYSSFSEGLDGYNDSFETSFKSSSFAEPAINQTIFSNIEGLSLIISGEGEEPDFSVSFASPNPTGGPAIADGSPTTWNYLYTATGLNTGTLEIIDANGDSLRFFISIGDNASFIIFPSSLTHDSPFGLTNSSYNLVDN